MVEVPFFNMPTGAKQVPARYGFTDCETYGHGFVACAMGSLDAPDYIPQGSVSRHGPTMAHRDWNTGHKPIGAMHDGN